jgi:hypothetical protein
MIEALLDLMLWCKSSGRPHPEVAPIKNIGYEQLRRNGVVLRVHVIGFLNVGMKLCNLYVILRRTMQDTSINHGTVV